MEDTKARALRYVWLMEVAVPYGNEWLEAMENIHLALGPCYAKEGDTDEEWLEAVCEAYEAEFKRLSIPFEK